MQHTKIKILLNFIGLIFISSQLFSQNSDAIIKSEKKDSTQQLAKDDNPHIRLKTRILKDRIMLRWAIDDAATWRQGHRHGFQVMRFTIKKEDGKIFSGDPKVLTSIPLKPKPLEEWRDIIGRDKMAAIIAQGIYGETFGMSKDKESVSSILEKNEELTQRFTFSLMAADQSFEAACKAGWGLIDSTVQPNERYHYRIVSMIPKTKTANANALVSLSEYRELPAATELLPQFGNKTVMLTWDYKKLVDEYNRYDVERSEDNINFKKVNKLLVTILNTQDGVSERMFYTDSLETNDKIYYYRVKGLTCFNEIGPPSEVVKGMGTEVMGFAPNFINATVQNDSTVMLEWAIMNDSVNTLSHFEISQSESADGNYRIVKTNIDKNDRTVNLIGLSPTNYFVISGVDKNGKKNFSYPYLVQPVDSTPPSLPIGLEGVINDSGRVELKWKANTDKDIYGYYVYRCNVKGEELSILTSTPFKQTVYIDSVNMLMTNPKVYYAIAAVDERFNQSKIGEIIEVTKPDKIPPMTPVFTNYYLKDGKVQLKWSNSPSEDVAYQRIYKKTAGNTEGVWTLVKEFKGNADSVTTDSSVLEESMVHYTIIAIDNSKNESKPTPPLTVTVPKEKKNAVAVNDLKAEAIRPEKRINIAWQYKESGVLEYQLYKSSGTRPFSLWKVVEQNNSQIADADVISGHVYKYAIRAIFNDGRMSAWKEIKVEF